ncbi:unnamed protein product [Durusdinium trenchii]|uniref:Uncharacterized protein n=1 Tax=Durusdinium trenchii TaxID=1381693 RepID=A0ABP0NL07_9DINO
MTNTTDPNGPMPMEIDRIKGDGKKGKGKTKDGKGKSKGKEDRQKGKGKGGKPGGKEGKGKGGGKENKGGKGKATNEDEDAKEVIAFSKSYAGKLEEAKDLVEVVEKEKESEEGEHDPDDMVQVRLESGQVVTVRAGDLEPREPESENEETVPMETEPERVPDRTGEARGSRDLEFEDLTMSTPTTRWLTDAELHEVSEYDKPAFRSCLRAKQYSLQFEKRWFELNQRNEHESKMEMYSRMGRHMEFMDSAGHVQLNDLWSAKLLGRGAAATWHWTEVSPHLDGRRDPMDGQLLLSKWPGRSRLATAVALAPKSSNARAIYVTGGQGAYCFEDFWASEDGGQTWYCMCRKVPWGGRLDPGLCVVPTKYEQLVLLGGIVPGIHLRVECDVWISSDAGSTWQPLRAPDWEPRCCPLLFFMPPQDGQRQLLVLGGARLAEASAGDRAHAIGPRCLDDAWSLQVDFDEGTGTFEPLHSDVDREVEVSSDSTHSAVK